MSIRFDRPVGAAGDFNELEYVTALHQSSAEVDEHFEDGSINAEDISYFLLSRHGISVSPEVVRKRILSGVGGGDGEDRCMDIPEMVSLLMIPLIANVVEKNSKNDGEHALTEHDFLTNWQYRRYLKDIIDTSDMEPPETVMEDMLRLILHKTFGYDPADPPKLTKELLKNMFSVYNEDDLANNDALLEEMIAAATADDEDATDEPVLNLRTFTNALTHDIKQYDIKNDSNLSTLYDDVFNEIAMTAAEGNLEASKHMNGSFEGSKASQHEMEGFEGSSDQDDNFANFGEPGHNEADLEGFHDESMPSKNGELAANKVFTFPQIDLLSENFMSQSSLVLSLLAFFVSYLAYNFLVLTGQNDWTDIGDCNGGGEFGCKIAQQIVKWLFIMVELIILGVPYITILNLGNRPTPQTPYNHAAEIILGMIGVVFILIVPGFVGFDADPILTVEKAINTEGLNAFFAWCLFAIGIFLFGMKFSSLFHICFSDTVLNSPFLTVVLTSRNVTKQFNVKQAATFKVNRIVKNALELHSAETENDTIRSSVILRKNQPLYNYNSISNKVEPTGGVWWAWKQFLIGKIATREGVWINGRIKAGVSFQFVFALGLVFLGQFLHDSGLKLFPLTNPTACEATFVFDQCELFTYPNKELNERNETAYYYKCDVTFTSPQCLGYLDENYTQVGSGDSRLDSTLIDNGNAFSSEMSTAYIPDMTNAYALTDDSTLSSKDDYCAMTVEKCALFITDKKQYDMFTVEGKTLECVVGKEGVSGGKCGKFVEDDFLSADDYFLEDYFQIWKFTFCVVASTIAGVCWGIFIAISYIPSAVSTVLRYRTGVLPSLHYRPQYDLFELNRSATSRVSIILGAIFWGDVFSTSILICLLLLVLIVLFLEILRPVVINAVATLVGISFTIGFKMVIVAVFGKRKTRGFYTSNPVLTNIFGLALEVWSIAIASGYMLARTIKITLTAVLFIARIDIPFLANGADMIGPVYLDPYPFIFRQDLLAADAHHHPYIERLGSMYMMSLRYGDKFCNMAGSTWRLLFIFALMPWLQQGRISDIPAEDGVEKSNQPSMVAEVRTNASTVDDGAEAMKTAMIRISDLLKENERLKMELSVLKEVGDN